MGSKKNELSEEDKAAKKAARKAAKEAITAAPEAQTTKKAKKDKKDKKEKKAKKGKEKKEKRKQADVADAPASTAKRQRAAGSSAAAAGDDKLRFWRVTLRGLPSSANAAYISELLAPTLALPAEMIRLPPDAKMLSEGEASFTLKVAAEADAARGLKLGPGVSIAVEEVAAGVDEEVFVRYLPFVATSQEVEGLFAKQGNVVKVKLMAGARK